MAVGSTIGGYLPTLVGYSSLGAVSLLCSAVGGSPACSPPCGSTPLSSRGQNELEARPCGDASS